MPRRTQRPSEAIHKAQDKKRKPSRRKASPKQQRPSEAVHKSTRESRRQPATATPKARPRVGPGSSVRKPTHQGKSIKRGLAKSFPVTTKVGKAGVSAGKAAGKMHANVVSRIGKKTKSAGKSIAKRYGF